MAEQEVPLAANGQEAKFINEMFEYDTSDFSGSVRFTAPGIAQKFTGVAIEMDAKNGIYTTPPVIPLEGTTPAMKSMVSEE